MEVNPYIVLGECFHIASSVLLLTWIIKNKSCKGISGNMQLLCLIVYITRYTSIGPHYISTLIKLFYLLSGLITVLLIHTVFDETYEARYDTFGNSIPIIISFILALFTNYSTEFTEGLWAFSRYLEVMAVIPQFYMIYGKRFKSNLIRYYVLTLLTYRGFYFINWIYRYLVENHFDAIIVIPGVLQFFVYFVFFFLPHENSSDKLPTLSQKVADNLPSVITFNFDGKNEQDLKPILPSLIIEDVSSVMPVNMLDAERVINGDNNTKTSLAKQ